MNSYERARVPVNPAAPSTSPAQVSWALPHQPGTGQPLPPSSAGEGARALARLAAVDTHAEANAKTDAGAPQETLTQPVSPAAQPLLRAVFSAAASGELAAGPPPEGAAKRAQALAGLVEELGREYASKTYPGGAGLAMRAVRTAQEKTRQPGKPATPPSFWLSSARAGGSAQWLRGLIRVTPEVGPPGEEQSGQAGYQAEFWPLDLPEVQAAFALLPGSAEWANPAVRHAQARVELEEGIWSALQPGWVKAMAAFAAALDQDLPLIRHEAAAEPGLLPALQAAAALRGDPADRLTGFLLIRREDDLREAATRLRAFSERVTLSPLLTRLLWEAENALEMSAPLARARSALSLSLERFREECLQRCAAWPASVPE